MRGPLDPEPGTIQDAAWSMELAVTRLLVVAVVLPLRRLSAWDKRRRLTAMHAALMRAKLSPHTPTGRTDMTILYSREAADHLPLGSVLAPLSGDGTIYRLRRHPDPTSEWARDADWVSLSEDGGLGAGRLLPLPARLIWEPGTEKPTQSTVDAAKHEASRALIEETDEVAGLWRRLYGRPNYPDNLRLAVRLRDALAEVIGYVAR